MRASNEELDQALKELQKLRSRHELILNAAGEGIYGLDCEGRTTFGNAASTQILGWKPDNIIGQPAHDVHYHSRADRSPYPRVEERDRARGHPQQRRSRTAGPRHAPQADGYRNEQ